jgi:hypothetical protein
LRFVGTAAAWLQARPRLGHDVFAGVEFVNLHIEERHILLAGAAVLVGPEKVAWYISDRGVQYVAGQLVAT